MDIGVSSNQLDEAERGFSFRQDGPLDMRMGATGDNDMAPELSRTIPAEVIVNNFPEEEIADIIYQYGEERLSRKIAKAIVTARKTAPIRTTKQLASIIFGAVGSRTGAGADGFKHPAVRTFQALRIYVNDELNELRRALKAAEVLLLPSAPLTVTTFHSLEDRIVKEFLKRCSLPPKDLPYTDGVVARSSEALDESDLAMFAPGEQQNERENEKARLRAKREKRLMRASGGKSSIGYGFGEPLDTEEFFKPSFEIVTKRTVKPTRQEVVENKRARSVPKSARH
ncbi:hypothetical protein HDU85_004852 [Gaertneriomyces sp. JEL0708]|nr:hypothetical protein HDU85_004852 [Gaertneriomyces sp. JEL0708]